MLHGFLFNSTVAVLNIKISRKNDEVFSVRETRMRMGKTKFEFSPQESNL